MLGCRAISHILPSKYYFISLQTSDKDDTHQSATHSVSTGTQTDSDELAGRVCLCKLKGMYVIDYLIEGLF